MGTNLGLDLVAEGIETRDQWEHLKRVGCPHGQGYLFSRPVPAEQASDYLRAASSAPARYALAQGSM
jgi:EAL domain-containing protein (putative c-di-GMP-specific phosphodiesterase class I)